MFFYRLVRGEHSPALEFTHKAEGLAVLDEHRLFVAYDDDRQMGLGGIQRRDRRRANEAPYTALTLA